MVYIPGSRRKSSSSFGVRVELAYPPVGHGAINNQGREGAWTGSDPVFRRAAEKGFYFGAIGFNGRSMAENGRSQAAGRSSRTDRERRIVGSL
jgi:hypothetical protein